MSLPLPGHIRRLDFGRRLEPPGAQDPLVDLDAIEHASPHAGGEAAGCGEHCVAQRRNLRSAAVG